jgi:large subunit ribosomal protein L25
VSENALNVEIREGTGKGVARKLRAAGRIPGIFYGKKQTSVSISLESRELRRLLERSEAGMNTLIDLKVSGGGEIDGKTVLVRDLQRDPVRGEFLHADFYAVDLQHSIDVRVPIHITGRAQGVELGGILDHALRELDLECLPTSIPREILVDVSALDVGDSLHVRDLELPEGVTLKSDPDLSVISVVSPSKMEEEVPEAEALEGEEAAAEEGAPEGEEKAEAPSEEKKEEKSGD